MNESERFLHVLEPPPGGLARLLARRNAQQVRWAPQWWALAAGAAAAMAWAAILSGETQIQMRFSGARLIGERSEGLSAPVLEGGTAIALPSSDANVRIYRVEPAQPESRTTK
jgi:hypothetical protein